MQSISRQQLLGGLFVLFDGSLLDRLYEVSIAKTHKIQETLKSQENHGTRLKDLSFVWSFG